LANLLDAGWKKEPPVAIEVDIAPELDAASRAEAAVIDARLREPSREDLMRKIEALEARLESALGSDPTEEQKRSKRSADAANAARARWDKREQTPDSSVPAVEDTPPT
jgi:hypothetical protein